MELKIHQSKFPCEHSESNNHVVYQNPENITPIVDKRFLHIDNTKDDDSSLEVGGVYEYQPPICDEYQIPSRKYELRRIVHKNDLTFLIVKPLNQDGHFVSIPRHICDYIGVPFEHGLTMLSSNIKLTRVKEEFEEKVFDGNDMSTYPTVRGKLTNFIIKLSGFTSYRPTHFITSNGSTMSPSDFMQTLEVKLICNDTPFHKTNCHYCHITNALVPSTDITQGSICDKNGDIYLLVNLPIAIKLTERTKIQDLISVTWLEHTKKDVNDLYGTMSRVNEELMKDGVVRVDDYGRAEIRKNGRWCRLSTEEFNKIREHLQ